MNIELRIDKATLTTLEKIAKSAGVSVNTVIKVALAKYLLEAEK